MVKALCIDFDLGSLGQLHREGLHFVHVHSTDDKKDEEEKTHINHGADHDAHRKVLSFFQTDHRDLSSFLQHAGTFTFLAYSLQKGVAHFFDAQRNALHAPFEITENADSNDGNDKAKDRRNEGLSKTCRYGHGILTAFNKFGKGPHHARDRSQKA